MRTSVRVVALLVSAQPGLMVAFPWAAAHAASDPTATPSVARQAWFWQTAYEQANPPVAVGPAPATEPSGVPKGDLAVAYTGDSTGGSSKMSVVAFDLSAVHGAATVDDFTVSLTLDGAGTTVDAAGAPIVACLPTRDWSPADGGDFTNEPTVDCGTKVKPAVNGSTYTFKLAALAQSWVDDQNLGVAFVNDPANTTTAFQAVFAGGAAVKAAMQWTPTVVPSSTGSQASGVTAQPAGATTVGAVPAPAPPPAGPPQLTMTEPPMPAPQVAPAAPVASAPAASVRRVPPSSSLPTAPFWVAAIGVALLVAAASLVLGDPVVPAVAGGRGRLDRVLRARNAATTSLTAPTLAPRGA